MTDTIREMRITMIRWEAENILSVELRMPDNSPVVPFTAGGHIDLYMPSGLVRSYSLLNDPAETSRYVIGVALPPDSRGGSQFIHKVLRVGDMLRVGGPRNNFPLDENAPEHVLIAGGIGITPMLAMLRRLSAIRHNIHLYYAVRDSNRSAFVEDIVHLCPGFTHHIDAEHGHPLDLKQIIADHPDAHFYCCGPQPMLRAFEEATAAIAPERVHLEYFAAPTQPASEHKDQAFSVICEKSGRTVNVTPDESIARALEKAGISISLSCEEGICGSCETAVISGEPDHRDSVLSKAEKASNRTMMVCVSRCLGKSLTLDI